MIPSHRIARRVAQALLPPAERRRLTRLPFADAGHGYDPLGLHPDWVAAGMGAGRFLYERYFRVTSHDSENIPQRGAAILAANHSGTLPFDAVMLYADVVHHTNPPRVPRMVMDLFVPLLPFVGTLFARTGGSPGARANFRWLLENDELVGVFPEGTEGIGKPFSERYVVQHWRMGHAELAIRHRVPVVPVAIIGAEEALPQLGRIRVHPFGAPWLPIPLSPVPLPVHYHVWYGEPLALHEGLAREQADDPRIVAAAAAQVRAAVQALVDRGVRERPGVLR